MLSSIHRTLSQRVPVLRRLAVAVTAVTLLSGCFTLNHTVGSGPQGYGSDAETKWYALFGLVRMGQETDSNELARGAEHYRVTTEFTTTDVLISAVPSILGFYRQSIILER